MLPKEKHVLVIVKGDKSKSERKSSFNEIKSRAKIKIMGKSMLTDWLVSKSEISALNM